MERSWQTTESLSQKRPVVRAWFVAVVLCWAALFAWLVWPPVSENDPYELSRADGKLRFYATTYPNMQRPVNLTLPQRLMWEWTQYMQRHVKRNPNAYSFDAVPSGPYGLQTLLNNCMEATGTQYLIAVEICGVVEFGSTNSLNGTQWVAACEHAIETSRPVVCYDYAKKSNFTDALLLIREPGKVKVVPRRKLGEYRKAGLVRGESE